MKNVKKVIAGIAAVAALIAVPTASAFADSNSDDTQTQVVASETESSTEELDSTDETDAVETSSEDESADASETESDTEEPETTDEASTGGSAAAAKVLSGDTSTNNQAKWPGDTPIPSISKLTIAGALTAKVVYADTDGYTDLFTATVNTDECLGTMDSSDFADVTVDASLGNNWHFALSETNGSDWDGSDGEVVLIYKLTNTSSNGTVYEKSQYTVTITSNNKSCSKPDEDLELSSLTTAGVKVTLDGEGDEMFTASGTAETDICLYTADFSDVSTTDNLPEGYKLTLFNQIGDGGDGKVTLYFEVRNSTFLRVGYYKVTITSTNKKCALTSLTTAGIDVKLNGKGKGIVTATGRAKTDICLTTADFADVSTTDYLPEGYKLTLFKQVGDGSDGKVTLYFEVRNASFVRVGYYKVTITSNNKSCSTPGEDVKLDSLTTAGVKVTLDGEGDEMFTASGTAETDICLTTADFADVSSDDLEEGYKLTLFNQIGDGSDGKVTLYFEVRDSHFLRVGYYKVTITSSNEQCDTTDGGDEGDTTEPGDDDTTDGDDEGDTTEPGDESTEEAASSEEASDEETESESNTLAQTGSVLAGVGVFALLALLGSAVVFVVRKRV